jgi:hypothetical protein
MYERVSLDAGTNLRMNFSFLQQAETFRGQFYLWPNHHHTITLACTTTGHNIIIITILNEIDNDVETPQCELNFFTSHSILIITILNDKGNVETP